MLSKNIRTLRENLGYTQAQIGGFLGVSAAAVTQYETGVREIPVEVVSKLSLLFNVDEYELYQDSPQQQEILAAFAFRSEQFSESDLKNIIALKKIILNYFHLLNTLNNEK
ncbi:MAG: helix-turn-helix domain-containing protein [Prevotellaceae bacterium]|jgi:transcriptional regulator with XRE-family HTH domain|nr:helix-turn-helix domain-containing protein [Prevotellaceae bacterium]